METASPFGIVLLNMIDDIMRKILAIITPRFNLKELGSDDK